MDSGTGLDVRMDDGVHTPVSAGRSFTTDTSSFPQQPAVRCGAESCADLDHDVRTPSDWFKRSNATQTSCRERQRPRRAS
ncbi:hypothetical protein EYF80_001760 [Liparis tanakae]|uniref:Uncharacterized protein n=1 Tax=Liparis tanakae TaxID=230148 RepID=A0A4Z2JC68_9TELE|nr:hypothetical protein EYF80_001760 [Liparis tanakae]